MLGSLAARKIAQPDDIPIGQQFHATHTSDRIARPIHNFVDHPRTSPPRDSCDTRNGNATLDRVASTRPCEQGTHSITTHTHDRRDISRPDSSFPVRSFSEPATVDRAYPRTNRLCRYLHFPCRPPKEEHQPRFASHINEKESAAPLR